MSDLHSIFVLPLSNACFTGLLIGRGGTPSTFSIGDMIYELDMPCANTAKAYLVCDKETAI